MITRSTVLSINSVSKMPSAIQNMEYPISLSNVLTPIKQKSIYYITVYASPVSSSTISCKTMHIVILC